MIAYMVHIANRITINQQILWLYVCPCGMPCYAETESRRATLASRIDMLEEERLATQHNLTQERQAMAAARQEAAKLQKELTDLQVKEGRKKEGRSQITSLGQQTQNGAFSKLAAALCDQPYEFRCAACPHNTFLQAVSAVAATQASADRVGVQHSMR